MANGGRCERVPPAEIRGGAGGAENGSGCDASGNAPECVFPELFRSLYATGEVSGQLDLTLQRLHRHYEEQAGQKFQNLAAWTPKLLFMAVAIGIGYQVVHFYTGYFDQLNKIAF